MKKVITIDGSKIHDLDTFYDEIENKLTKGLDFRMGRSINAYLDVLYGGFGVHEYEEEIELRWSHSDIIKTSLSDADFDEFVEVTNERTNVQLVLD